MANLTSRILYTFFTISGLFYCTSVRVFLASAFLLCFLFFFFFCFCFPPFVCFCFVFCYFLTFFCVPSSAKCVRGRVHARRCASWSVIVLPWSIEARDPTKLFVRCCFLEFVGLVALRHDHFLAAAENCLFSKGT